jgi:hypothetical protein
MKGVYIKMLFDETTDNWFASHRDHNGNYWFLDCDACDQALLYRIREWLKASNEKIATVEYGY